MIVGAALVGLAVGLGLSVLGGAGSILATPLLIYVVGVRDPHVAIGTSAVVVSASALLNAVEQARRGRVCWPVAVGFAAFGCAGAYLGSLAGKATDGARLESLLAVLMIVIGIATILRGRGVPRDRPPSARQRTTPVVAAAGAGTGLLAGFFGIGGGFLIVPVLILVVGLEAPVAVGSSLAVIAAFGATTAASYAASGLVVWSVAAPFMGGAAAGGALGSALAPLIGARRGRLELLVGLGLICAAAAILYQRWSA